MQPRGPRTSAQRARYDALSARRMPPPPPPGPIARATINALSRVTVGAGARAGGGRVGTTDRPAVSSTSLRRNVCPHFYMTGVRGAIPIHAPHLLKGLMRQEANVSRCQLRGGVHLEQGYVSDICLSSRFNQCVFYEDELTRR